MNTDNLTQANYLHEQPAAYATGRVTCLGIEFPTDEARRAYFTERLREHLKDPAFRAIKGFPIGEDEASPDATGKVTRTRTAGGSVSVGRPVAGDLSLVTVLGVEDGDLLVFGPPDTALDQTVQVTVPPRAGAGGYEVAGPCVRGFGGTELTFTAYVSRPCGPSHSLLAVAAGSGTRAYLIAPAVSFPAGAAITVTGTWVA